MLSLHSLEQEAEVFKLIQKTETRQPDWYYLGFSDRSSNTGYQWTDGTGVDYLNWAAGQPQKNAASEECSVLVSNGLEPPESMGWFSEYCQNQAGFICQIVRGAQPQPPPTYPPETQPDAECNMTGEDGDIWYSIEQVEYDGVTNKKCVLIVSDQTREQWDAERKCEQKNGHLLTLHHMSELHDIMNVMRDMPSGNYWIGLKYDYNYINWDWTWWWEDETFLNFDNWAQNEPKEDSTQFNRAYFHKDTGRWISAISEEAHPFICQRWPAGTPTPPPEPIKQGGCPTGWYPYKNRCFQYNAFDSIEVSERKLWNDANAFCNASGGALATVPSLGV